MDISSYISGFTDGEGCFCVSFNYRTKLNLGIEVRPSFSISQNQKNKQFLLTINKFFQCGGIRYSSKDKSFKYEVRNLQDLNSKIIPHFEKFPLLGIKKKDFELFKKICLMMKANLHKNKEVMIWTKQNYLGTAKVG